MNPSVSLRLSVAFDLSLTIHPSMLGSLQATPQNLRSLRHSHEVMYAGEMGSRIEGRVPPTADPDKLTSSPEGGQEGGAAGGRERGGEEGVGEGVALLGQHALQVPHRQRARVQRLQRLYWQPTLSQSSTPAAALLWLNTCCAAGDSSKSMKTLRAAIARCLSRQNHQQGVSKFCRLCRGSLRSTRACLSEALPHDVAELGGAAGPAGHSRAARRGPWRAREPSCCGTCRAPSLLCCRSAK